MPSEEQRLTLGGDTKCPVHNSGIQDQTLLLLILLVNEKDSEKILRSLPSGEAEEERSPFVLHDFS